MKVSSHIKNIFLIIFYLSLNYASAEKITTSSRQNNFKKQGEIKRVLIILSFNYGYTWTDNMIQGIDETFKKSNLNIETYLRFMDMKRVPYSDKYFMGFKNIVYLSYKEVKFDAIIACNNDAFNFILKYRNEIFPGIPVVFSSINDFSMDLLNGFKDISGTSMNTDYSGTIKCALKLFPKAGNLLVFTDGTTTGLAHRSAVQKLEPEFSGKVNFQYLSLADYTLDEASNRLSSLSNDTVVLLLQHFRDKTGTTYTVQQSTPYLTENCSVPCFVISVTRLGFGTLGGRLVSSYHHGEAAADMAIQILNGKDVKSIPVTLDSPNKYMFDYNALKRFNISLKDLPSESIVINLPDTFFAKYKKEVLILIIFMLMILILLILMFLEILRRHKIEDNLKLALNRLNLAALAADIGIWDWDIVNDKLVWDERMYTLYGVKKENFKGAYEAWLSGLHPEDVEKSRRETELSVKGEKKYDTEFRIIKPDGSVRYIKAYGNIIRSASGDPVRMIGINYDITESKITEEKIQSSLKEKEVLLKELYHRTKNNMQVICAMIELQSGNMKDKKVKLLSKDIISRIQAMSLVHKMLYMSKNLSKIDFGEYFKELNDTIMKHYNISEEKIHIIYNLESIEMSIDSAMPCGLVINELLSNVFKYAFPDNRKGNVRLELKKDENEEINIVISDYGIGIKDGYDIKSEHNFGIQIVYNIIENQLQGTVDFINNKGLTWIIKFKEKSNN